LITVIAIVGGVVGQPFLSFLPVPVVVLAGLLAAQYDLSRWRTDTFLAVSLTAVVWLSYGMYELQLVEWVKTIKGAPIRSDLLFLIPLLFSASAWTIRSWNAIGTASKRGIG
jgi:hypothetical protein